MFVCRADIDGFAKDSAPSLRGAKRRGNLLDIGRITRLPLGRELGAERLRFARNDKWGVLLLFTNPSKLAAEGFYFLLRAFSRSIWDQPGFQQIPPDLPLLKGGILARSLRLGDFDIWILSFEMRVMVLPSSFDDARPPGLGWI